MRRRGRRLRLVLPLLLTASACASGGGAPTVESGAAGSGSAAPTSVRDGVYTPAQAQRGAVEYATACSSCHAADLRGNSNAPSLVGVSFLFLWEDKSLDELYTSIRTLMPTNAPGSLSTSSYLQILAYILEANGFPAGDAELVPDPEVLGRIAITGE